MLMLLNTDVPEIVPNVTVNDSTIGINGNNVTLTLTWREPFNNYDPIVNYTVSCSGDGWCPPNFTTTDSTTRSYTITNLTTMTNYTFSVVATNPFGSGEAGVVIITTPDEVTTTTVLPNNTIATAMPSVSMITDRSSEDMTTTTSNVGITTTTVTTSGVGMTTTTSSVGITTTTSSVGMTTTKSSEGMTTTISNVDTTTTTLRASLTITESPGFIPGKSIRLQRQWYISVWHNFSYL